MPLNRISEPVRRWWLTGGRRVAQVESQRLGFGCAIGSVVSLGVHIATRDPDATRMVHDKWPGLLTVAHLTKLRTYAPELAALALGVSVIVIPSVARWLLRYARAWWAGITGIGTLLATIGTVWALSIEPVSSTRTNTTVLAACAALLAAEVWRQSRSPAGARQGSQVILPVRNGGGFDLSRWPARNSDDPIADWSEDIIGRAAVVELLADHVLNKRTPVVALHGGLGDGKSSVLNLLRSTLDRKAIVVSFTAWLPGSETALATEIFKDIAIECRHYLHVPQLRQRALAFARLMSDSVPHLSGLRGVLPPQSQREEVEDLRGSLSRIPMPIAVLVDEIDRMQKEELQVLLKILRGACSIRNVTFVCAFSEGDVRRELGKDDSSWNRYLEKFFPVSIRLSPPTPEIVAKCLQSRLRQWADEGGWCRNERDKDKFSKLLGEAWEGSLQPVCTNLRRAARLLNDLIAAGDPIAGEVNPFDLVLIETMRIFYPAIYEIVRKGGSYLTGTRVPSKDSEDDPFSRDLQKALDLDQEPGAIRHILAWLFPKYARTSGDQRLYITVTNVRREEEEGRILDPDFFQVYFRSAVPEEMFSNAELDQVVVKLNSSKHEEDAKAAFDITLNSLPPGHPKRDDFLFKLARNVQRLNSAAAEYVAYAAAARAADYQYDHWTMGETGRAVNVILAAAQRLADTPSVQRVLETAMNRSSDDTLPMRLLQFIEDKDRNRILTDYTNVTPSGVNEAFLRRMRDKYSADRIDLSQADFQALRRWAESSDKDRQIEQTCLRKFVGQSRQRLARLINVIYPGRSVWTADPVPIINNLFPIEELKSLLQNLPNDEVLDEAESHGIARIRKLFEGDYPTPSRPPAA